MIPCPYCGPNILHTGVCPRVKAIEYHENGTMKRVELHDARMEGQCTWPNCRCTAGAMEEPHCRLAGNQSRNAKP